MLCTEDKGDEKPDVRDTLYLAVPTTSPGFSISGEWNPLGMRGTVTGRRQGVRSGDLQ